MILYRAFRNDDPPAIARLWNSQPRHELRMGQLSPAQIDERILSKAFFDRRGLIFAVEDERVIGLVHAGFGPDATGAALDRQRGCILMLLVEPRDDEGVVSASLLDHAARYLLAAGATTIEGGFPTTLEPFYWGLTGGSGAPGVPSSEPRWIAALEASGYLRGNAQGSDAAHRLYRRSLPGYKPQFDRQHLQWRRSARVTLASDERRANWWEACVLSSSECVSAKVQLKTTGKRVSLRFWDLRPFIESSAPRGQGLLEFQADEAAWSDGLARFVWSETLELFQQQGVTCVMAAAPGGDSRWTSLLTGLGFQDVGVATRYHLPADRFPLGAV